MEQTPVSEVEKMKKTYYEQLRGRNISSAELEQLKKKRIRQVAQIREGGDPAQYETARRYMAQVEAIEQLLREKETRQRRRRNRRRKAHSRCRRRMTLTLFWSRSATTAMPHRQKQSRTKK